MAYLLDTNVVIWAVVDDPRLGPASRRIIDTDPSLTVSMVSLWEVAIKTSIGKLGPMQRLPEVLRDRGTRLLAIENRHLDVLADLPLVHRDPFDRMLIAQAQAEGLTVVTSDAAFSRYDVPVLDARR